MEVRYATYSMLYYCLDTYDRYMNISVRVRLKDPPTPYICCENKDLVLVFKIDSETVQKAIDIASMMNVRDDHLQAYPTESQICKKRGVNKILNCLLCNNQIQM